MKVKTVSVLTILLVFGAMYLAAQTAAGTTPRGARMYDTKTETTLKGTIEDVETIAGRGMMGGGIHLKLKTDAGVMPVHVGPASYLAEQHLSLAKGDAIEVTGSKVKMNGADVVIAREIKKGDAVVSLRNAQGIPNWSRGRNR